MSARRLRRMLLLAGAAWCAAAAVLGVVTGRAIRHADRPSYTPQTDVPLWRDTDLPPPHVVQFLTKRPRPEEYL